MGRFAFVAAAHKHRPMLSPQAIQEFKDIYYRKFGERLDDGEARRRATRVLNLYAVIFDHLTSKSDENVKNYDLRATT